MAAVATLDLVAYRGEDYVVNGTHLVSEGGAVKNITGWTIVFTIRTTPDDTDYLLQVSAVVVSGTAGTYSVSLTSDQTRDLGVGIFVCDIWRTDLGSQLEMAIGTLTIEQPVNRVAGS